MGSFNELNFDTTPEQEALLKKRNFSLRPLSTTGHLDACGVLALTWQPILTFYFTLLVLLPTNFRNNSEALDGIMWCIGVVALLIFPTIALGVLLFGVVVTKVYSRIRMSAVVYWTWWPFWKFVMCVVAACVGTALGNFLWYTHFYPHIQLQRLQAYADIDPHKVAGVRLQDAGIVTFNTTAGVDRSRIGCLKNGAVYCVAPIVLGGEVPTTDSDPDLSYDLFMAGTDCCSCPGEFRCGDWNRPGGQLGGFRIVNNADRQFFSLAAQDWSASHHKVAKHPIFFKWVTDPLLAYNDMTARGNQLMVYALLAAPFVVLLTASILNFILGIMCESGVAGAIESPPPVPPMGFGKQLSAKFLPQMHKHYTDHQEQHGARDPNYVLL